MNEESAQERSHQPTERKLQKARMRGDIARSTDLLAAAAYGGLYLAALVFAFWEAPDTIRFLGTFLQQANTLAAFPGPPEGTAIRGAALAALQTFVVLLLLPGLLVFLVLLLQRGLTFTGSNLALKAERLSLAKNLFKRFGRAAMVEFAKNVAKSAAFVLVIVQLVRVREDDIVALLDLDGPVAAVAALRFMDGVLLAVLAVSVPVAVMDLVWQRFQYFRRNRMTRKELEEEVKESEGDPHAKGHRRRRAQEIAMNQMLSELPKADVVIVNPTHFAVALKWDRRPGTAPVCIAKGVDEIALTMRRMAEEAQVPVHSDPPTARALYAAVDLGQEIDEAFYRPVAAAIRFAEDMRARMRRSI